MPIFWRGEHCGFAAAVEHHTDIGGRFPGGMGVECHEIYEEGLRLPCVKYYNEGIIDEAVVEIIAANVRAPDDVLGDLEAAAASLRRGAERFMALFEKYGRDTVESCYLRLRERAERAMRAFISEIPDGSNRVEDVFYADARREGPGLKLVLTLKVYGDRMTLDYSETGPQLGNALNVPPDMIGSCIPMYLAALLTTAPILNSGLFAAIETIAPKGSVLNPHFPAAVGCRGQILWRLADMLFIALAQAMPDRVWAGCEGGVSMMTFTPGAGGSGGMITEIYASGWGARPNIDGVEGVMPLQMPGFRSNSGEAFEQEVPVALEGFGFVPDTGGPGRYRGALSVYRKWRYLADGRVMLRSARVDSQPYGLAGGRDGTPARAFLISGGEQTELPRVVMLDIAVKAGDVILQIQPGAGGYGDPLERDPARVLHDVLEEKLSPEYARNEYGVVVDLARRQVDESLTRELRRRARQAR